MCRVVKVYEETTGLLKENERELARFKKAYAKFETQINKIRCVLLRVLSDEVVWLRRTGVPAVPLRPILCLTLTMLSGH